MFDALILRYEEPIANNRWDSPLFYVLVDSTPPFDDISAALFERKPPPPNLATQNVRITAGGGGNVAVMCLPEPNNTKQSGCQDIRDQDLDSVKYYQMFGGFSENCPIFKLVRAKYEHFTITIDVQCGHM